MVSDVGTDAGSEARAGEGPVRPSLPGLTPEDAELLSRVPASNRRANGVPGPEEAQARTRAAVLVREALGDLLVPDGLRVSPLGAAWSSDLDLHLTSLPGPERLRELGWVCLDPLLSRLGWPGAGRWGVAEVGLILAKADLQVGPPPDPVRSVLERGFRRGEVRAREVLELRALSRDGREIPPEHPVVTAAAAAEASLGGAALARWRAGSPAAPPVPEAAD